jgi:hypothetical protein
MDVASVPLRVESDAEFVDVDRVLGERRLPLLIVPAVSVSVEPRIAVVPLGGVAGASAQAVTVVLASESPDTLEGSVSLDVPRGWVVEPGSVPARLAGPGSRAHVQFAVRPPSGIAAGRTDVRAKYTTARGETFARGYDVIEYPHIPPHPLFAPAAVTFSAFPVSVAPDLRVGYVEGAGDAGPAALTRLGVRVEALDAAALQSGDLAPYSAIMIGIRAYEVRPDLAAANSRLLEYVNGGGTLIVQYHRQEYAAGGFTPYRLSMAPSAGRVTDETSPVRFLAPEHPLLSRPNRIGAGDFEGWIQERGLYFADRWDERYTPLLELTDPGEAGQRGSVLATSHGRGRFVYVALSLFRQLPEAVPGAYRLLANLVSWGR